MTDFEYYERKSLSNLEKHGIDFIDAQVLWSDPGLLEIRARTDDEPGYFVIALVGSKFDEGKDVIDDLDLSKIRRPNQEQRRVNVDFPTWMIESLDREAGRLRVTRQSIKIWLAEPLEQRASKKASNPTP